MGNVKVCDCIMGSGKTESAIRYINEHPEKRFIYVTPYLPETTRVRDSCPRANFYQPYKEEKYAFSKVQQSRALIEEGKSIATTHAAIGYYTPDDIAVIKRMGYTIIIDEEVDVMCETPYKIKTIDIQMLVGSGYMDKVDEYTYSPGCAQYEGGAFDWLFRILSARPLIRFSEDAKDSYYFVYPSILFEEAEEVIVMTYLFDHSEMSSFFKLNGINYSTIGVSRTEDGGYRFSNSPDYIPDYVKRIRSMVDVVDNKKMNSVGDIDQKNKKSRPLTKSWYDKYPDKVEELRSHLWNYFNNGDGRSVPKEERMCGHYKKHKTATGGKGYTKALLPFNYKATNEFRNKTRLAYPLNLYMNRTIYNYYKSRGVECSDDRYALSTMIQWIWRSAIRDGKNITLYLPSSRMRKLLFDWMDVVEAEYKANEAAKAEETEVIK